MQELRTCDEQTSASAHLRPAGVRFVPAGSPSGGVNVFNAGPSATDVIIDMNGYFAPPTVDEVAPAITSATSASGTVGSAFSYQITATNSPISYSAVGLPTGLSVNTSAGLISGTPISSGTSTVTLGATNSAGHRQCQPDADRHSGGSRDYQCQLCRWDRRNCLLLSDHRNQLAHQLRRHGFARRLVG